MRHSRSKKILNMPSDQRKSVIANLVISLLKCGKIETTLAKAKVLRSVVEKMITLAKEQSVAKTRLLASRLDKESVVNIYEIAKKMADKKGGYTRVIKTWKRYGDRADTAIVEFAFNENKKVKEKKMEG